MEKDDVLLCLMALTCMNAYGVELQEMKQLLTLQVTNGFGRMETKSTLCHCCPLWFMINDLPMCEPCIDARSSGMYKFVKCLWKIFHSQISLSC